MVYWAIETFPMKLIPFLLGIFLSVSFNWSAFADSVASPRSKELLPGPWRFQLSNKPIEKAETITFDDSGWDTVTIPHTWSGPDGKPTATDAWYRTTFKAKPDAVGGHTYLYFEGVATILSVYVNGKPIGSHRGAYTASIFDITDVLNPDGKNLLAVKVSNDRLECIDCLPSTALNTTQLYKLYGGIYRKVWLMQTPATHIYPELASSGVFISQTAVNAEKADLSVRTALLTANDHVLTVKHLVRDAKGQEVASFEGTVAGKPGDPVSATVKGTVPKPNLWSGRNPYLYTLETQVIDDGKVLDAVTETIGLRSLTLDPDKGFALNGEPVLLRGINKHQETEYNLTAISDEDLRQDWRNIVDLGGNFVRLPHYPHARLEYDIADQSGIMVWAENGSSNRNVRTPTGDLISREMVRQNFNHPSIVMWSCGNETGEEETSSAYAKVIHAEDPSRLVTYASNGKSPGNLDFQAWNVYPYWYTKEIYKGGDAKIWPKWHYFSEYGAGGSIATHCAYGAETRVVDKYEPEEYQELMFERIMPTLFTQNPEDIRLFTWWTFREFGDAKFKGHNTKGLQTYSNFRKDVFYLYQSFLRPDHPVLHLCGKTHFVRLGDAARGIKVYGNSPKVSLALNGKSLGEKANGDYNHPGGPMVKNVFFWDVPFQAGRNDLVATDAQGHTDSAIIYALPTGATMPGESTAPVTGLTSSNPASPAYFIADAIRDQEPVYYQCDGQSDNTFDVIPEKLKGAYRIATRRLSTAANVTDLKFTLSPQVPTAEIFVLTTSPSTSTLPGVRRDLSVSNDRLKQNLIAAGFKEAGIGGLWRDNMLNLVGCAAWVKTAKTGETVGIPGVACDYVVLVRPEK